MAKLIPKQSVDEIPLKPERDVARELIEQLPPEVTVYHSYPWLRPSRGEKGGTHLDQGEADFVILHPHYGILDLEVKGGDMDFDSEGINFFRHLPNGRRKEVKNPFDQAQDNLHALKDKIMEYGFPNERTPRFVHGYATIFPDTLAKGDYPPGSDPKILLDQRHLKNIAQAIKSAFDAWDRRTQKRPIPDDVLEGIKAGLHPAFRLVKSLGRTIDRDEEALIRLTKDQARILQTLKEQPRALIKGVAGSGKTVIAFKKAIEFAEAGRKTLFLCYNSPLADWLTKQRPENLKEHLEIQTFHGWCRKWCIRQEAKIGGVRFVVPSDTAKIRDFWDDESASLLMDAIDLIPDRFDAVVVDEAQDFCADWWYPIEQVLDKKNEMSEQALYVFYDPAQNIYNRDLKFPQASGPFNLIENCRNTQKIGAFCKAIAGHDSVSSSDAPEGEDPVIRVASTREDQRQDIQSIIKDLMGPGGVEPSQVVILVSESIKNSSFSELTKIGKLKLSDDFQSWRSNESILLQTAKRFKGLEADIIILADVPDPETEWHFKTKDLYVAASRAKHRLFIFCKDQTAEQSIKKWLVD